MPEIISNTSCLILLSKIQRLHVLKDLYESVIITDTVLQEFEEKIPDYIFIKNPSETKALLSLKQILDPGEASTIALALEIKNSLSILDDYKARNVAGKLNLKITGTLGILHKAYKQNIIPDFNSEVLKLKEKGIWISDKIINSIELQ